MIVALWFVAISVLCSVGCVLADRTNLGAGLAAGVKGRPCVPTETQE